mgnify:CR=1 FL=1
MTSFGKIRNLLAAFAAGVVLLVGYTGESQAAPCPASGTYATLVGLGSCEIGDKTFSGFIFQQIDTTLTAANVVYDIVNSGGQWGFEFGFNLVASGATPPPRQVSVAAWEGRRATPPPPKRAPPK